MNRKPAEILADGAARLGIAMDHGAAERLARYFQELKKWSKTYNLVAKAPDLDLIEKHFLDSLTLLPLLQAWGCPSPLLDIGTGAGFPGLALKVGLPELQVTLLEPRQKRVAFLKHIVRTLQLESVTIVAARLEANGMLAFSGDVTAPPMHLEPHPVITSRAFTQIAPFLDLAAPVCPPNGRLICMRGGKTGDYPAAEADAPFHLAGSYPLTLPFSNDPRTLLVFTRQG